MKILVCGSREWTWEDLAALMRQDLLVNAAGHPDAVLGVVPTLIHGGGQGADFVADKLGRELGWTVRAYPANWARWRDAGGPMRNRTMLLTEHARRGSPPVDLVLAYPRPGSKGTWDMVSLANTVDIKVLVRGEGVQPLVRG